MRLVVRKCSAHRAKGMDSPVGVKMSESRSPRGVDRLFDSLHRVYESRSRSVVGLC